MKATYAGWMENLGVEPLLRFFALRSLPILAFLLARLILVSLVLEAICISLSSASNLPPNAPFVKAPIILEGELKIWFLPTKTPAIHQYFYHPKDRVSVKYLKGKHAFAFKGKKMGLASLSFIYQGHHSKEVSKIPIWVADQQDAALLTHFQQVLQSLQIPWGPLNDQNQITLSGTLNQMGHYLDFFAAFHSLGNKLQAHLDITSIKVPKNLRLTLLNQALFHHFHRISPFFFCELSEFEPRIICSASDIHQKELFAKRSLPFVMWKHDGTNDASNYLLKLKLVMVELNDDREVGILPHQMETTFQELVKNGGIENLMQNPSKLSQAGIRAKVVASPRITLSPDVQSKLQLGSDIPFENAKGRVEWRFAGLLLELTLRNNSGGLELDYNCELTRSDEQNISGTKGKSTVKLELNRQEELFNLDYYAQGSQTTHLPYIGDIPFIGNIFSSKNEIKNQKKVYLYAELIHGGSDTRI